MQKYKILVAGGGIAGLTTALVLARTGHEVEVFERADTLEPIGAGIQVSPNALAVLAELGLEKQLLGAGSTPNAINMMDALTGRNLARIPLGDHFAKRYELPYLVIHRADLQEILLQACEESSQITVKFGSTVSDIMSNRSLISVEIFDGREKRDCSGDVLIAADGVHSIIRKQFPEMPDTRPSGKTAWRALIGSKCIKNNETLENTMLWLGPDAHAVTYPVRGGDCLNVIAITKDDDRLQVTNPDREQLARKFSEWKDDFTDLFEHEAHWSGWPVYEMEPPKKMAVERIAFVGDAAHAMLPFAAQGAACAIEDAWVLGKHLGADTLVTEALTTYASERMPRVARVMKAARTNGTIYHLGGVSANLRNLGLKAVSGSTLLKRQDWIYNWRP